MMENLHLQEGNSVIMRRIQVPNATYVKLQPHTKDFLEIANPKAMYKFLPYSVFDKFYNCCQLIFTFFFFFPWSLVQLGVFTQRLLLFNNW